MSRHQILLVAPQPKLAGTLHEWLGAAGHDLIEVSTFATAKASLSGNPDSHPDMVITSLKLGDYNGLHLALRAQAEHIPAIVVGPADPVLERDATALGATYLSSTLRRGRLIDLVEELLAPQAAKAEQEMPAQVPAQVLVPKAAGSAVVSNPA
jgi:DNA-binding NtrC family response regulator